VIFVALGVQSSRFWDFNFQFAVIGVNRRPSAAKKTRQKAEGSRQNVFWFRPRLSAAQKTGLRIKDQGFSIFISVCFRVFPWLIGFYRGLSAARFAFDLIRVHLRSSAAQFGLGFRRRSSAFIGG
jgi:hypothetical protein